MRVLIARIILLSVAIPWRCAASSESHGHFVAVRQHGHVRAEHAPAVGGHAPVLVIGDRPRDDTSSRAFDRSGESIATSASGDEHTQISDEERGEALVNKLMKALSIKDEKERIKAIIPLVHKSLLNSSGDDLNKSVKEFSFKKASAAVSLYQIPVKITRVAKGKNSGVGFGDTAEAGRSDRFFVAKRNGVVGLPAPIVVFFPVDGGEPKIVNMGSL